MIELKTYLYSQFCCHKIVLRKRESGADILKYDVLVLNNYLGNKFVKTGLAITLVLFVDKLLRTNRIIASRAAKTSLMVGTMLITNFFLTSKKFLFALSTIL